MGEVKRISISLKVDTGDETYWSLIEPLQNNRQLSTFIITCLKAYVEDSDIHDAIDAFNRKGSGVDKIREHIENLMKLQAKANRTAEDINSSLGGDTEELEIENVLDEEFDEPEEQEDYSETVEPGTKSPVAKTSESYGNSGNSGNSGNRGASAKSNKTGVAALPESVEPGALNKIIKRLDSLEQTVGNLSSRVGSNAEHISKIEGAKKSNVTDSETRAGAGVYGKQKTVEHTKRAVESVKKAATKEPEKVVKIEEVKKASAVSEVKFDDIPEPDSKSESDAGMDFSDLLTGFMDSVQ